jgi:hypothetical protein
MEALVFVQRWILNEWFFTLILIVFGLFQNLDYFQNLQFFPYPIWLFFKKKCDLLILFGIFLPFIIIRQIFKILNAVCHFSLWAALFSCTVPLKTNCVNSLCKDSSPGSPNLLIPFPGVALGREWEGLSGRSGRAHDTSYFQHTSNFTHNLSKYSTYHTIVLYRQESNLAILSSPVTNNNVQFTYWAYGYRVKN